MAKMNRILVSLALSATCLNAPGQPPDQNRISEQALFIDGIYKKLDSFYARPLPPFIIRKAVDAMTNSLDPYTRYLDSAEASEFRMAINARYGGLGVSTLLADSQVTIREVFAGSPADKSGLQPGDVIAQVGNFETKGKLDETIDRLRGAPGSELQLTIARPGIATPISVHLVREEIKLKAVPYFGILENNIGYILVNSISSSVSGEVEAAFHELSKHPMNGLIIDLRQNMGGALLQAVKVANFFIQKGQRIVSIKGRAIDTTYYADNPALNTSLPMVVLTSDLTASSAEVLAGALQDNDRAVIIGQPSYGKGLIQTMYQSGSGTLTIITTAHYYTPSGRCLQSTGYSGLGENNDRTADTTRKPFYTSNGRELASGKGIVPDILTAPAGSNPVAACLSPEWLFKFAFNYKRSHPSIAAPTVFKINESDVDRLLAQYDIADCNPYWETMAKLVALRNAATREGLQTIDPFISQIEKQIAEFKTRMLQDNRDFIKSVLEQEIARLYYKESGALTVAVRYDAEVAKAIEILRQPMVYKRMLHHR